MRRSRFISHLLVTFDNVRMGTRGEEGRGSDSPSTCPGKLQADALPSTSVFWRWPGWAHLHLCCPSGEGLGGPCLQGSSCVQGPLGKANSSSSPLSRAQSLRAMPLGEAGGLREARAPPLGVRSMFTPALGHATQ